MMRQLSFKIAKIVYFKIIFTCEMTNDVAELPNENVLQW